jgi:hypothetical protein
MSEAEKQVIDITKLSEIELKALAYDELKKQEFAARNLQLINAEIMKRCNIK